MLGTGVSVDVADEGHPMIDVGLTAFNTGDLDCLPVGRRSPRAVLCKGRTVGSSYKEIQVKVAEGGRRSPAVHRVRLGLSTGSWIQAVVHGTTTSQDGEWGSPLSFLGFGPVCRDPCVRRAWAEHCG